MRHALARALTPLLRFVLPPAGRHRHRCRCASPRPELRTVYRAVTATAPRYAQWTENGALSAIERRYPVLRGEDSRLVRPYVYGPEGVR